MRNKTLIAYITLLVILVTTFPITNVFAKETVLFECEFNNTFENDRLGYNWNNGQVSDSDFIAGKFWAAPWGTYGGMRDAEDGSLAVVRGHDKNGVPIPVGTEDGCYRNIVCDMIADDSEIDITFDFRTPDKAPENSGVEMWLQFKSEDKDGNLYTWIPFTLQVKGDGIVPQWAIVHRYPNGQKTATGKQFSRVSDKISFTWGKNYTVKLRVLPNLDGSDPYTLVAEVWEDGKKLGIGVVDEWDQVTSDKIKLLKTISINLITKVAIMAEQEPEDLLYLKAVKVVANQPDTPVEATFFPENGCTDASIDTDVYADFVSAVFPVDESQVVVSGGASVASVNMRDNDKRIDIKLNNVKNDTAYTVEIKNVKGVNADSAFDYKWSFTTDSGIKLNEPYFGSSDVVIDATQTNMDISDTVSLEDDGYLNGEVWGISDTTRLERMYRANGNMLSVFMDGQRNEIIRLKKKFIPLTDGENLNISSNLWITNQHQNGNNNLFGYFKFGLSGDTQNLNMMAYRTSNDWNHVVLLHEGDYSLKEDASNVSQSVNIQGWGKTLSNGKVTSIDQQSDAFRVREVPNCGKSYSYLDGTVAFNFTATPNKDDSSKYDLIVTLKGNAIDVVATKIVDKSYVLGLKELEIGMLDNFEKSTESVKITDLKIEKTFGKPYPVVGMNITNIPFTNLSGNNFDADILIVERDMDTNVINKATVVNKKDVTGESGIMDCAFEILKSNAKIDIYALNSVDGMILLSDGKSFEVGE